MATLPAAPDPDATRKRARDPTAEPDAGEPPAKRASAAVDVIFRVILPSKQVGRVIGKQGTRIQQVRASTGATIKIADAAIPGEDRVIIISSKDEPGAVSSAETALIAIATLILTESGDSAQVGITGEGALPANAIRLLIAGSQAGGLIGISGQNIGQIRDSSGASINVLAQNQLPLCACAQESDRVVQIAGNAPEVLNALGKIACKLRENPPKEPISIKPRHNHGLAISNTPYLSAYAAAYLPQSSVDHVTSEMLILEKLVGGLIGKNGYNISKIRAESGATIKISGAKGEGEQRLVQFSGSTLQVSLARTMVENYIYSQLLPQNAIYSQLQLQNPAFAQLQPPNPAYAQLQPQNLTYPQLQPQNPT